MSKYYSNMEQSKKISATTSHSLVPDPAFVSVTEAMWFETMALFTLTRELPKKLL